MLIFGHFVIKYFFSGDSDQLVEYLTHKPEVLYPYFFAWYVVGVLLMFPPNVILFTLAIVFTSVYGNQKGALLAGVFNFVCQLISNVLAFFVGRFIFYDFIYKRAIRSENFFALNRAVRNRGAWISFLIRVSMVFPHAVTNYSLSVTDISLCQYILGSLAIIPVSVVYIMAAISFNSLHDSFKKGGSSWFPYQEAWFLVIGFIFMFTVVVCIVSTVKSEL